LTWRQQLAHPQACEGGDDHDRGVLFVLGAACRELVIGQRRAVMCGAVTTGL
jgi:hypothetical protein